MRVQASAQQFAMLWGQGEIALSKDDGGPAEMVVQPTRHMRTSGACAAWHAFPGTLRQPYLLASDPTDARHSRSKLPQKRAMDWVRCGE